MTGTSILQVERETLLANDLFLLADELEHVQAKRGVESAVFEIDQFGIMRNARFPPRSR